MKKYAVFIVTVLLMFTGALFPARPASAVSEFDLYVKAERFIWKEYDSGTVVEESGPLFGIGASGRWYNDLVVFGFRGEVFGGRVDYDGQTTGTGTPLPVDSDTDYLGAEAEGTMGIRILLGSSSTMELYAGPAIRYWSREIQSTSTGTVRVAESKEKWLVIYAPVGIRGSHALNDHVSIFAGGGVNLPVYNENEADLSKLYGVKVTVEPGKRISAFAEAGLRWKRLKASLYYEGMRFSESDPVSVDVSGGRLTVFQPKSEADRYGLLVGLAF
ncbi:MAG: hypothetical protein JSU90_10675 [Nitrospiraceae bacterium]|nr:MAG: hypothetical protein JSU90_10675 [Nitrospiraceae bacterium]